MKRMKGDFIFEISSSAGMPFGILVIKVLI